MSSIFTNIISGPLRDLRDFTRALPYYGKARYCPVCDKSFSRFRQFGRPAREDAQCPRCNGLERHRLLWLYLSKKTDFFSGLPRKMLHVAPESCFRLRFKKLLGDGYLTADLLNPSAMVQMDITNIQYPDQSFDIIYCCDVLEHVQDDRKAMSELHRVLKSTGWAILLVPISAEKTYEDPSIVKPEERLKAFGQEDHVRKYGPDYVHRLRSVGFQVESTSLSDLVEDDEAIVMGLANMSRKIYYCTK